MHSYRTRIKTPGHLVEKIIRRRVENYRKYKELTKENYLKFVTDIIGFRGLLLYREDWVVFHKYLLKHFENHASWYVHDCLKDFDESRDRLYGGSTQGTYATGGFCGHLCRLDRQR